MRPYRSVEMAPCCGFAGQLDGHDGGPAADTRSTNMATAEIAIAASAIALAVVTNRRVLFIG